MKNNEQFYTEGCAIIIEGDDDVRLHYWDDYNDLRHTGRSGYGVAEVHYRTSDDFNSLVSVTDCGRGGSKLGCL